MGFFDSIGDALGDVAGSLGGIFEPVSQIAGDITGLGGLLGFGSSAEQMARNAAYDQWQYAQAGQAQGLNAQKQLMDIANNNARQAAESAFNRSWETYNQRYQASANDMRRAGLNPILAASGGFSVGGQPTATPAQTFSAQAPHISYVPDLASSAKDYASIGLIESEAEKAHAETGAIPSQIEKAESESARNYQEIDESIERVEKIRAETGLVTAEERNALEKFNEIRATIKTLEMDVFKKAQEVRTMVSQESLNYAKRAEADAMTQEIRANIGKIGTETQNLRYQGTILGAQSKLYEGPTGKAVSWADKVKDLLPGLLLTPGVNVYKGRNYNGRRR